MKEAHEENLLLRALYHEFQETQNLEGDKRCVLVKHNLIIDDSVGAVRQRVTKVIIHEGLEPWQSLGSRTLHCRVKS